MTTSPSHELAQQMDALPSATRFTPEQRKLLHRLAYGALSSGDYAQARRFYEGLTFYGGSDTRAWRAWPQRPMRSRTTAMPGCTGTW